MSKKPQYDPEEIRYPDQRIVEAPLVPEVKKSYIIPMGEKVEPRKEFIEKTPNMR